MKGDFIGFSFKGIRSEDLGLARVSVSDRYEDNLIPSVVNRSTEIPGGDGEYYWGSQYSTKEFTLSVAFDSLTEAQLRKLRRTFNAKEVGELILDEEPYKIWTVQVSSAPQFTYLCMNTDIEYVDSDNLYDIKTRETGRVYKGEGTIQLTAYYPFAKSKYRYLSESTDENLDEWAEASCIPAAQDYEYEGITYHLNTNTRTVLNDSGIITFGDDSTCTILRAEPNKLFTSGSYISIEATWSIDLSSMMFASYRVQGEVFEDIELDWYVDGVKVDSETSTYMHELDNRTYIEVSVMLPEESDVLNKFKVYFSGTEQPLVDNTQLVIFLEETDINVPINVPIWKSVVTGGQLDGSTEANIIKSSTVAYTRGQAPDPRIEEYYITHLGIHGAELENGGEIYTLNAGDVSTPIRLFIEGEDGSIAGLEYISYKDKTLFFDDEITLQAGDSGVVLDTSTQLLRGYSLIGLNREINNHLYNQYIKGGNFFHIDPVTYDDRQPTPILIEASTTIPISVEYDYLYY